jgi:alkylhydroperoxidase/carboxymuconolactone decarboxylase family protein YurZ
VDTHESTLRKLAIGDDAFIEAVLGSEETNRAASHLDPKTHALVRLGALIALDARSPSYMSAVEDARGGGASEEEIVGALVAVLPALGAARVVAAAPELGLALGYDVAAALEAAASGPGD